MCSPREREAWIWKGRNPCYFYDRSSPLSAARNDKGLVAGDTGLKPAAFDAMTAAARIEYGDCRKGIDYEGSGSHN